MRTMLALAATLMLATAAGGAPNAATAPPRLVPPGGMTLVELRDWLQESGYKAKILTADDGTRYIESSSDGLNYDVDLYDCDATGRCASFKCFAYFEAGDKPFELAVTNRWNLMMRWTSAYIADDGEAVVQQDINLPDNTSYAALTDNMNIWFGMLNEFSGFVYKPLDAAKK